MLRGMSDDANADSVVSPVIWSTLYPLAKQRLRNGVLHGDMKRYYKN